MLLTDTKHNQVDSIESFDIEYKKYVTDDAFPMPQNPYTLSNPEPFGAEFTTLTKTVYDLGFDGVLYSFYPKPMYMNSKVQIMLHYSESFAPYVSHYIASNYGNRDFVLRLILEERKKAIDWWEEIRNRNVTREERKVTEDGKQNFGIQHGLTIPVLNGTFAVAGISVISKNQDLIHFQKLKKTALQELHTVASEYHARIINSKEELRFFMRPLLENLSATQKKVIRYVITGKPMKSIPHTYGVSPRYAEKVLLNIRNEFGNISTNELIYFLGLVNIYDYL